MISCICTQNVPAYSSTEVTKFLRFTKLIKDSMVPVLTIPESAFDPSQYARGHRKQSNLVLYLLKLTRGSALLLTVAYLLGVLWLKPVLEITAQRRYEYLEHFRHKMRDCYLGLIGKVSHIPIVAINRGDGKLYADAIVQTDDSYLDITRERTEEEKSQEILEKDILAQGRISTKLGELSLRLKDCTAYLIGEIPHYKTVNFTLKELQNKIDLVYLNTEEPFCYRFIEQAGRPQRKKNMISEIRDDVRGIKGLFMSGKA